MKGWHFCYTASADRYIDSTIFYRTRRASWLLPCVGWVHEALGLVPEGERKAVEVPHPKLKRQKYGGGGWCLPTWASSILTNTRDLWPILGPAGASVRWHSGSQSRCVLSPGAGTPGLQGQTL